MKKNAMLLALCLMVQCVGLPALAEDLAEEALLIPEVEEIVLVEEAAPAAVEEIVEIVPAAEEAPAAEEIVLVEEAAPAVKVEIETVPAAEEVAAPAEEIIIDEAPVVLADEDAPITVIEDAVDVGEAAAVLLLPEDADEEVLAAFQAEQDVLAATGAATEFVIDASGIIRQYNGTETVVVVQPQVLLNGVAITVRGISNTAFSRNTTITSVTLPSSVDWIEDGAFKGCTALRYVNLPNAVTTILPEAFSGCTSLEAIAWSESISNIGNYAFYGCTSLRNLALPTYVTSIGDYAFYGCSNLNTITWSDALKTIGDYAFGACTALDAVILPASLRTIDEYAFAGCTALRTLNMQNGLESIGTGAFQNCSALTAINIPDTVTYLGNSAFENCSAATSLSLSAALPEILNFTFKGCASIPAIYIPYGVTRIGREAFEGCASVTLVYTIPATVIDIGNYAFSGINSDCWIYVDNASVNIGTDGLGTACTVFGYKYSTTQAYANAHENVRFFDMQIVNFVRRCYNLILGRTGEAAGVHHWSQQLALKQLTGASIVHGFMYSAEFAARGLSNSDAVEILYNTMLDRASDAAGKAGWVSMLDAGSSYDAVIRGFCGSYEFGEICRVYGIEPGAITLSEPRELNPRAAAFVTRCYELILQRTPDNNGLNNWTDHLISGRMSAAEIVDGFILSPEFVARALSASDQVEILYQTMLSRASDASGKATWLGFMNAGTSLEYVVNGFADSIEFKYLCTLYGINPGRVNFAQNRDKNLAVTLFVNRCSRYALNHGIDADSLNYWTGEILSRRMTPAQVAESFIFSYECLLRGLNNTDFIQMLYRVYLGTDPDAAGMAFWTGRLASGDSRQVVAARIAGSADFAQVVASFGLN